MYWLIEWLNWRSRRPHPGDFWIDGRWSKARFDAAFNRWRKLRPSGR